MKKYLIMSLAMAACSVMVSGCAEGGSAGEVTDGSIQEAPASAHVIPEGTAEPVIQESIVQEPSLESDDWKPTQKVLDFERKHGIQRPGATNKE